MKKVVDLLKSRDVGAIGIGAMIVFIAMVLVAGIAASVLIQTSTRLESQAMATGQETIAEVSSGLSVFDIIGKKNTDLQYLAITVRARAGAPDIEGMLMEYAQTRDPQLAVAICDTLIEMMAGQGAPAGEPGMAPPMARSGMKMSKAPIFKK